MTESNRWYGVPVERGVVTLATENGFVVRSYSRDGITTPPIKAVPGVEPFVGCCVYFFMFDDGKGQIVGIDL